MRVSTRSRSPSRRQTRRPTRPTCLPRCQSARRAAAPRVKLHEIVPTIHRAAQALVATSANTTATDIGQPGEGSDGYNPSPLLSSRGQSGAGTVVPPRSRLRDARPPNFRGGGSLSKRGASCSAARPLCVWSLARSLPLLGRSPLRGTHGAAAGGGRRRAALEAPLLAAPRWRSWRRLSRAAALAAAGRSAAALCSLGTMRSAQRLALSACGR